MKAKIVIREGVYLIRFYDYRGMPVDCIVVDDLEFDLGEQEKNCYYSSEKA